MAKMSRCCACEHYTFKTGLCEIYSNKIPKDIFAEFKDCKYYNIKHSEHLYDEDLPIAKGR